MATEYSFYQPLPLCNLGREDVQGRWVSTKGVIQGVYIGRTNASGCFHSLGRAALGIIQIAIVAGTAATIMNAGRYSVLCIKAVCDNLITIRLGGKMVAQCALLHNALVLIVITYTVRAGIDAILAADAFILINQYDIVLWVSVRGASGANTHARRILALLAMHRQPVHLNLGILAKRTNGKDTTPVVTQSDFVLELTSNYTGITT
jgi:hypothetical protein